MGGIETKSTGTTTFFFLALIDFFFFFAFLHVKAKVTGIKIITKL